jgi:FKBP-type peptidyl-prolyl cis-trans isomerase (trigger factor)
LGQRYAYTMFLQRRVLSVSCHLPCEAVYSTVCSDVRAVSSCQVPGFRPGKTIPENVLINYVGPQHVQDATIEAILKHTLPQALSSVMNS